MNKKIITLGTTVLTTLTLAGITQPITSFADNVQPQEVLQKEGVNIPDANLKKALNQALNQNESANITAEQLAQIKSLDLSQHGISSLEGLQYCTNLEFLNISNLGTGSSTDPFNTFSDLSPLKNLHHLTTVDFRFLPVTDVSPLRNSSINWMLYGWSATFFSTVEAVTNEDGTITLKNPCVGFDGEALKPDDLKGGVYNEKDNTITWSKENFKKNVLTNSDHQGHLELDFHTNYKDNCQWAYMGVYVKLKDNADAKASACDNIYRISSVCDQTKCLDNNANNKDLFVWSKVEQAENHYFNFHFIKDDIVKISSKDNTRWLTTNGQIGSTITQTNNEQEASYWKIKQLGNNKVALHYMGNKKVGIDDSNLSLNICGGNVTDGTKVILYPSSYDNYMNQQFILN